MKKYDIYFRRNNKEKFWELEDTLNLVDFGFFLDKVLASSKEKRLEIKLILREWSGNGTTNIYQ